MLDDLFIVDDERRDDFNAKKPMFVDPITVQRINIFLVFFPVLRWSTFSILRATEKKV